MSKKVYISIHSARVDWMDDTVVVSTMMPNAFLFSTKREPGVTTRASPKCREKLDT